jgi:hypothetical protein
VFSLFLPVVFVLFGLVGRVLVVRVAAARKFVWPNNIVPGVVVICKVLGSLAFSHEVFCSLR